VTPRRPRLAQLRTRVLAGVLSITLVTLAAFDIAAVTALRGYLIAPTDAALHRVINLVEGPRLGTLLQEFEHARPAAGIYYIAFVPDHGRTVVLESDPGFVPRLPSDLTAIAASQRAQTVTSRDGQAQLRLQAVRAGTHLSTGAGALVVSTSLGDVNQTVGRLQLIVTVGSAVAGLLVFLGVAWVVRRGLRPIETMARQADRITAGDLTDRVSPQDSRTEVGRLGAALNGMLARIEASIREREASQELMRRFFADASHELRNPLASLRANAELYQQGALPDRPHIDEAMRRIGLETQRMSGLVDDMLRLARLDQHPSQQHEPVDITDLLRECIERAQIAGPQRAWQADIAADLMIVGDEELLRRAIDNILVNVHAHTPGDTVATITATGRGSTVTIEVSDNGPGVPASQLPHIFERFYRAATQAHRPGSGLGLAIVTAIATAHQGTAEAALNDPHGLRIMLTLPACAQSGAGQPPTAGSAPGPHASPADVLAPT